MSFSTFRHACTARGTISELSWGRQPIEVESVLLTAGPHSDRNCMEKYTEELKLLVELDSATMSCCENLTTWTSR